MRAVPGEGAGGACVIVPDGHWPKALPVIRALGKGGLDVSVCAPTRLCPALFSRWSGRLRVVPDAGERPEECAQALAALCDELAAQGGLPVLAPMEEDSAALFYDARFRGKALSLMPPRASFDIACDKFRTFSLARQLDIPAPESYYLATPDDLLHFRKAHGETGRVWVVKPVRSSGARGVRYALPSTAADCEEYFRRFGACLAQERVGSGFIAVGTSFLFNAVGRRVAAFCHDRLDEHPPTGGASTYRVSSHRPGLLAMAEKLLGALSWRGLAMIEWKYNPATEDCALLEINPRLWGSVELPVRAGVNFPLLYAQACLGRETAPVGEYPRGLACGWLAGALLNFFRHGRKVSLDLPRYQEWDASDIRGSVSSVVLPPLQYLHPVFRKKTAR